MNEQELRERMQSSVLTEFGPHPIDPAADVARGRRGLRRRRLAGGLTAVASVAAVSALTVTAVSARHVPVPAAEVKPPVATQQTKMQVAVYTAHVRFFNLLVAGMPDKHLGRASRYFADSDVSWSGVRDGADVGELSVLQNWKQSGGTGLLWVSMARPKHALAKEKWCGPSYTPDLLRMTCTDRLTPKGKRVIVGAVGSVQNSQGVVYRESGGTFVRYVRPDGQVVIVAALGMKSLKRVADGLPRGVKHPDVTWQQLAAIATDPQLTLGS